jgi:hypothetical protein
LLLARAQAREGFNSIASLRYPSTLISAADLERWGVQSAVHLKVQKIR